MEGFLHRARQEKKPNVIQRMALYFFGHHRDQIN
jgi:hypothetical protein